MNRLVTRAAVPTAAALLAAACLVQPIVAASPTRTVTDLNDPGSDAAESAEATGGFASGGVVTRNRLVGPDPRGPDDGYAALNAGEGVITARAMKYYGKGFLSKLNRMEIPKK